YFGITDVKNIGNSGYKKMAERIKQISTPVEKWTWADFLFNFAPYVDKTTINNLIASNALSYMNMQRKQMLYEYDVVSKINDRETKWINSNRKKNMSVLDCV